jgi:hypothetical protein
MGLSVKRVMVLMVAPFLMAIIAVFMSSMENLRAPFALLGLALFPLLALVTVDAKRQF